MDAKDPPEQPTIASKDEPVQFDPSRSKYSIPAFILVTSSVWKSVSSAYVLFGSFTILSSFFCLNQSCFEYMMILEIRYLWWRNFFFICVAWTDHLRNLLTCSQIWFLEFFVNLTKVDDQIESRACGVLGQLTHIGTLDKCRFDCMIIWRRISFTCLTFGSKKLHQELGS